MIKGIIRGCIITSLLFFTNGLSIFAEDQTSEIGIGFTGASLEPTAPVDPDNPDIPSGQPGTGMGGPLSLDYVPAMDFGQQTITGRVETYELIDLKPYMQVTDKRGTGEGWRITASLTTFTSQGGTFDGVIEFRNAEVLTTLGNTSPPPISNNVSITSGQSSEIIFATEDVDEGLGTWISRWYPVTPNYANDSITLTVNTANILAETYTAQILWVIPNAP